MLRETNDWQKVKSDAGSVVAFTASWCGPCHRLKPQFARAAVQDAERNYYIVDVDVVDPDVLDLLEIKSVPQIFHVADDYRKIEARTAADIVSEVAGG